MTRMQLYRYRNHLLAAVAFLGFLLVAGHFWRLCERSDSIAYLPAHAGAEWIIDPAPAENIAILTTLPIRTVFKKKFTLEATPAGATLTIRAFKSATVSINGQIVNDLRCSGQNWKMPATANVTRLLQAGTNEITAWVTNNFGPPALWLRLTAGEFSLRTDQSWFSSPMGSYWLQARLAAQPPIVPEWNPIFGGTSLPSSLHASWPGLILLASLSFVLVFGVHLWFKHRLAWPVDSGIRLLLILVLTVRAVLFLHDAPKLPRETGFDAAQHEEYVKYIQEKKSLPLPNDGWEMHQPPLYYALSAGWLALGGYSAGTDAGLLPLRLFNGLIGLLHCWLVLLCLRRLFPQNFSAQAVGLLTAAFLPVNLSLSMYVTNDPLAGLLVTLAFYFFLRYNESENDQPKFACAIGLALGAGMLAKLNSLVTIPVFLAAMGLRLWRREHFRLRGWLLGPVMTVFACLLICGWHYYRVWQQIGGLPLPNCQTDPASAWWQFPGYRTAGYYWHFGTALTSPLFSSVYSFADGIYSTLWADGLISGYSGRLFRPPWNYELMNAGCVLALVLTGLAISGLVILIRRFIRQPEPVSFLIAGMVLAFAASIGFVSLQGPWLAGVKSFYALPALASFCALIAAGWIWLAKKNRHLQMFLWTALLFWALTTGSSFWIRNDNPQYWRVRAMVHFSKGDVAGANESIARALQLNPADVESHRVQANLLSCEGAPLNEVIGEYVTALNLQPDYPDVLNELAGSLVVDGQKEDVDRAEKFATRACQLTAFRQAKYIGTLAAIYAQAGQTEAAISAAQTAIALAIQRGDKTLQEKNQHLLDLYRTPPPD